MSIPYASSVEKNQTSTLSASLRACITYLHQSSRHRGTNRHPRLDETSSAATLAQPEPTVDTRGSCLAPRASHATYSNGRLPPTLSTHAPQAASAHIPSRLARSQPESESRAREAQLLCRDGVLAEDSTIYLDEAPERFFLFPLKKKKNMDGRRHCVRIYRPSTDRHHFGSSTSRPCTHEPGARVSRTPDAVSSTSHDGKPQQPPHIHEIETDIHHLQQAGVERASVGPFLRRARKREQTVAGVKRARHATPRHRERTTVYRHRRRGLIREGKPWFKFS